MATRGCVFTTTAVHFSISLFGVNLIEIVTVVTQNKIINIPAISSQ